jgi:hypothetical protein
LSTFVLIHGAGDGGWSWHRLEAELRARGDLVARMDAASAQRVLLRLREMLAAHETGTGVLFDSRTWLVTARRAGVLGG